MIRMYLTSFSLVGCWKCSREIRNLFPREISLDGRIVAGSLSNMDRSTFLSRQADHLCDRERLFPGHRIKRTILHDRFLWNGRLERFIHSPWKYEIQMTGEAMPHASIQQFNPLRVCDKEISYLFGWCTGYLYTAHIAHRLVSSSTRPSPPPSLQNSSSHSQSSIHKKRRKRGSKRTRWEQYRIFICV